MQRFYVPAQEGKTSVWSDVVVSLKYLHKNKLLVLCLSAESVWRTLLSYFEVWESVPIGSMLVSASLFLRHLFVARVHVQVQRLKIAVNTTHKKRPRGRKLISFETWVFQPFLRLSLLWFFQEDSFNCPWEGGYAPALEIGRHFLFGRGL